MRKITEAQAYLTVRQKKIIDLRSLLKRHTEQEVLSFAHCRKTNKTRIFVSAQKPGRYQKLVLFDVDGTIIKQSKIIDAALKKTFKQLFGLDIDLPLNYQFYGKTDAQVITDLVRYHFSQTLADVGDIRLKRIFTIYIENYIALIPSYGLEACEFVVQTVEALSKNRAICVGLLTGNLEGLVAPKLKYIGLDPSKFLVGAFGSDAINRYNLPQIVQNRFEEKFGYKIEFSATFLIGDTPRDIECADAVGAKIIAVASGEYSLNTLKKYRPSHALNNLCDVAHILEIIMG